MNVLGVGLMVAGVVGFFYGMIFGRRVRHITSQSMWLTIFALVLFAGLALQAVADGWDVTR